MRAHSRDQMVMSMDLADHATLRTILGQALPFHSRMLPSCAAHYLGWGRKWSGKRAVAIAKAKGVAFQLVEDGFLRSVDRDGLVLSMIFDNKGIFYDASHPSALEYLVQTPLSAFETERVQMIIQAWRSFELSKYNKGRDNYEALPAPYVLVADQVAQDMSIRYGLADAACFDRMLQFALDENAGKTVVVKLHPDALAQANRRHFALEVLAALPGVQVIADERHVARLIAQADTVYTVTSQVGFEALIWGKRVRCFGMPFYAGWGLTEDELPAPERRKPVTLEQLVHAALVKYPRYIDPVTMQRCEPEVTFRHVGLQRRKRQEFPEQITAIGFSRWKRPFIASFLQGSDISFVKSLDNQPQADQRQTIAVWGSTELPDAQATSTILRIEDGFLRSSGLGADLVRPLSLVIDDVGIYYDVTRPSRLEHILQSDQLDETARERARALRERLIELDLTKYNIGKQYWTRPETSQRVLLVVGQVETDASIRLGSPDVQSNIELLRRVRTEHPSAYIIYKPHPDVVAGLRKRGQGEDEASKIADAVISQPVALSHLLSQVNEVHTMTSLLGFEALLRGAKVVCHGLPFYAGWGLTEDKVACARRTRALSIDELVHGALIAYPRYYNFERNCFVEPEQAIDQLAAFAETGPRTRTWWRKALRLGIITWLKVTGSTR